MSHLNYFSNSNSYPNYANSLSRSNQENIQQILESILQGIRREATAIELYRQLASIAPNQKHKNDILLALEGKKAHLSQFTHLYVNLTGTKPVYQIAQVPFDGYQDGLQKAFQSEVEGYQEYNRNSYLTQHPQIRNVFLWAVTGEQENANRFRSLNEEVSVRATDYGPNPFVIDINEATKQNNNFRTAIWTGDHLQITLMSIGVGEDIGLEIHPDLDQFLRIEQGQGLVQMGDRKDRLDFRQQVADDFSIVIPAGKWHNLTNTGKEPLKLYSIYAPPQHPKGTVHETKAVAMAAEEEHHQ
jgi:mannose-6-phosphate isomerase-like protein (cupin superfamily)/rubrerythrin